MNLNIGCRVFNQSHMEEDMPCLLTDVLEEWKVPSKIHVLLSDSAANMLSIMNWLPDEQEMDNIRCLNHILNFVVRNNILKSPEIKKTIKLVRKVIGHSHRSTLCRGFKEGV